MRRPQAASKAAIFAASILLAPYIAASQHHEQVYHRNPPVEQGHVEDGYTKAGIPSQSNDQRIETTQYKHGKDTDILHQLNKASAVATNPQALAGEDHRAVRAIQPAKRGSVQSAGLSTPLQARSLQDWEVEDFVLLATVDGSIHARDRKTGAARWELAVDKPMVETFYHNHNKSDPDGVKIGDDFLWIVEPSRDGDIYFYNWGGLGGLQKLHLTVKQLVADMSPYESIDPAVVYNGEKRTKLYTVDATTGTISKVFGSGGALSKEPRCPKPGGLDILDDEECGSSGSFVLGRTEYIITIQNRDTTEPICTLKYSEWGPNTRDGDLHGQYSASMDNKYVYALHDGSIFGWDHGQIGDRQRSYTQKLASPVVRVFDVARPLQTDDQDPQLIVLPQPLGPIDHEAFYGSLEARNRIFVNHTEAGGWFAMSENTYPLVTGRAKEAQCYDQDWIEWTFSSHCSLAQRQEGFVGVHALSEMETRRNSPLLISDNAQNAESQSSSLPDPYDEESRLPALRQLGRSKIIDTARENPTDVLILILLALGAYCFLNWHKLLKAVKAWNKNNKLKNPLSSADQAAASVPTSPTFSQPAWKNETDTVEARESEGKLNEQGEDGTPTKSPSSNLLGEPPEPARNRSDSVEQRSRPEGEKEVRFRDQSLGPGEDENVDPAQSPQPGKKKARRGARGGVKHSKKKRSNSQHGSKDEVDQTVKKIMEQPNEPEPLPEQPKVVARSVTEMTDPDGTLRIGHLTVSDTVLGYGGHGTMVYRGTFGGRDVAVKRMLRDFYDIASHEVGLLQESDDHPNVIRYYDKEEDSQFFYIALELCPASLQDVIERPQDYPDLMKTSDPPEMLRQITAGLHYLHTLKIVHRDIKPQNILVSAPKANPLLPTAIQQPRLLISDFGLCKKLEADQNSFRATTAHAAGTSGWRAPELLVDDDPTLKPPASTAAETNNSEPLVIDTQTKRSATRAIDIFSLGCIFYYCLTNGQHPFDKQDKFMREANIVKGFYNIDALGCLGDYQWEARDLIESMLQHNPKARPDAGMILRHPFFWGPGERLQFLCDVSDGFEHEKYELDIFLKNNPGSDASSEYIDYLEECAPQAIDAQYRGDFLRALPHDFILTLGKQRKYKGGSLLDLLRALRNKRSHYDDMPDEIKRKIGGLPEGYLSFWTRRFPNLLLTCWRIVEDVQWTSKDRFRRFYGYES